jgi:hypothetical protein
VISLYFMPAWDLPEWTGRLDPYFQRMADKSSGRMLVEDIFALVARAAVQVWIVLRDAAIACVIITEIVEYPRLREMRLVSLVGKDPKSWAHVLGGIEAAARVNFKCSRISGLHPKKYRSLLPGYKATHWLSEKAL